MSSELFTCACCKGTFEKEDDDWSDDHALKELEETFPDTSVEECDPVCDDCYKRLMNLLKN